MDDDVMQADSCLHTVVVSNLPQLDNIELQLDSVDVGMWGRKQFTLFYSSLLTNIKTPSSGQPIININY